MDVPHAQPPLLAALCRRLLLLLCGLLRFFQLCRDVPDPIGVQRLAVRSAYQPDVVRQPGHGAGGRLHYGYVSANKTLPDAVHRGHRGAVPGLHGAGRLQRLYAGGHSAHCGAGLPLQPADGRLGKLQPGAGRQPGIQPGAVRRFRRLCPDLGGRGAVLPAVRLGRLLCASGAAVRGHAALPFPAACHSPGQPDADAPGRPPLGDRGLCHRP